MKEDNVIRDKGLNFAIRVVKMSKFLFNKTTSFAEHPIISQILRSGTSIGANICEAEFAESKEDFKHKLKISLKEASETRYWLKILQSCEYINKEQYDSLMTDCLGIIKLLTSIINRTNTTDNK